VSQGLGTSGGEISAIGQIYIQRVSMGKHRVKGVESGAEGTQDRLGKRGRNKWVYRIRNRLLHALKPGKPTLKALVL